MAWQAYSSRRCIHRGAHSEVWRAIRATDGLGVVLKTTPPDSQDVEGGARLHNAWWALRQLDLDGCPRPVELFEEQGRTVLVTEDLGGSSLDRLIGSGPLSVVRTLALGVELASTLAGLHRAGFRHGDVKPANVVVSPDGQVQLIDFGLVARIGAARRGVAGTPAYLAPEGTGRLDEQPDNRTDLYALGVTLFELLTGRRPFERRGAAGQVFSHLAVPAQAVTEHNPDVPEGLASVIARLLEKMPADRFQSAEAVARELRRCMVRWDHESPRLASAIEARPGDPSGRLFERDKERGALAETFAEVQAGATRCVLIAGKAGEGKTALAESLRPTVLASGGGFASGKYDAVTNIPYRGLALALTRVLRGLLAGPASTLLAAAEAVGQALGTNSSTLAPLVPELTALLGEHGSSTPRSGADADARFGLLFRRFVQALPRQGAPLVLFLDDLQWADTASLRVVADLVGHADTRGLMVIGAYRSEEVGDGHPLQVVCDEMKRDGSSPRELRVGPLSREGVRELVSHTLGGTPGGVEGVVTQVLRRTGGNPFYVRRVVKALRGAGALVRRGGAWQMAAGDARRAWVDDDIATLMARELDELPSETRRLVQLAACLGNAFSVSGLADAARMPTSELRAALAPALSRDLLVAGPETDQLGFVHDRIQEAAYEQLPLDERRYVHLEIGRGMLRANGEARADLYACVRHLVEGEPLLEAPEERARVAALARRAGEHAMETSAFATAVSYLSFARRLLGEDIERADALRLSLLTAEAEQLRGRHKAAKSLLDDAASLAQTSKERCELARRRVTQLTHANRYPEALDAGLQGIRALGLEVPDEPDAWEAAIGVEMGRLQALLAENDVASLAHHREATDEHVRLLAGLIEETSKPSYSDPVAMMWLALVAARLSIEHGLTAASANSFVVYGVILTSMGQPGPGLAFGNLGLSLARRQGDDGRAVFTLHVWANFVAHWSRPFEDTLPVSREAIRLGMRTGRFAFGAYAAMCIPWMRVAAGHELSSVLRDLDTLLVTTHDTLKQRDASLNLAATRHALRRLTGARDGDRATADRWGKWSDIVQSIAATGTTVFPTRAPMLMAAVLLRDEVIARREVEALRPQLLGATGFVSVSEFTFYAGIQDARDAGAAGDEPAALDLLNRARAAATQLDTWAEACPANFNARALIVHAALLTAEGRHEEAADRFDGAIAHAHAHGARQLEGIALEGAGRAWLASGRHHRALLYLTAARTAFGAWGAQAVVDRLEAEFPDMDSEGPDPGAGRSDLNSTGFETSVVSRAGVLTRLLARLLQLVIEDAGAERAILLLERSGRLVVEARVDAMDGAHVESEPAGAGPDVSMAVLHLTHRTGTAQVIADTSVHELVTTAGESIGKRAVLCAPVELGGAVCGVIYLDNALTIGGFSLEQAELATTLGSVAAAVVDTSRRESGLADRTRTLAQSLAIRNRELSELQLRQRLILDSLREGVLGVGCDHAISFCNERAAHLLGGAVEDFVGRPLIHTPARLFEEGLDDPGPRDALVPTQAILPADDGDGYGDGEGIPVEWLARPMSSDDGSPCGMVVTFQDITPRRRLETRLRQARKMEALGKFAGGMAHEFNNLLTPILGYADLVGYGMDPADPKRALISGIAKASERAAELVGKVMAFGRRSDLFLADMDLRKALEETRETARQTVGPGIPLEWRVAADLDWITGDPGHLRQLVLNLVSNAGNAVAARGDGITGGVRVSARNRTLGRNAEPPARAGRFVVITVADDGIGFDQATEERLYEPFFTTRKMGGGVGLGLSVVQGIVDQHDGWIDVRGAPGQGATFEVYLPARDVRPAERPPTSEHTPDAETGRLILLVDDEDAVRAVGMELLAVWGYQVLQAASGHRALELYESRGADIDLVILDLLMPGLSGRETLERLLRMDPDVRVLLWSGYALEDVATSPEALGAWGFMSKPFRAPDLQAQVARVLNGV